MLTWRNQYNPMTPEGRAHFRADYGVPHARIQTQGLPDLLLPVPEQLQAEPIRRFLDSGGQAFPCLNLCGIETGIPFYRWVWNAALWRFIDHRRWLRERGVADADLPDMQLEGLNHPPQRMLHPHPVEAALGGT
jgi:hypothetical protein